MADRSYGSLAHSTPVKAEHAASAKVANFTSEATDGRRTTTKPGKTGTDNIVSYIPALRIYARSLTRNMVDSDDLVQETLVRGLASIESYQPGSNMRAWLFTIMRNRFYTNCGKSSREPTGKSDCVASVVSAVSDGQMWHLRRLELVKALLDLPIHYREAILLVGVLGESYKDAAEILDCDIGTIKSRVSRARAALAQVIDAPVSE